jgi:hypothetical protein
MVYFGVDMFQLNMAIIRYIYKATQKLMVLIVL